MEDRLEYLSHFKGLSYIEVAFPNSVLMLSEFTSWLESLPFILIYPLWIEQGLKSYFSIPRLWDTSRHQFRVLDLFRVFHGWIPSLKPPKKILFRDQACATFVYLFVLLIFEQTPIYIGLPEMEVDILFVLRQHYYGKENSLLELGILPVVVTRGVLAIMDLFDLLEEDESIDHELRETAKTVVGIISTMGLATLFLSFRCPCSKVGIYMPLLILLQLSGSGFILLLLDQIHEHYKLAHPLTLHTTMHLCRTVFWQAFSPNTINRGRGPEFEGVLLSLLYFQLTWRDKWLALYEVVYRQYLPNLITLGSTISIFTVLIYLHGMKVDISVRSKETIGLRGQYPIKLLYLYGGHIVRQYYVVSHLALISQILQYSLCWCWVPYVRWLGTWDLKASKLEPVSGLGYYLVAPTLSTWYSDPRRFVIHVVFVLFSSALFAYISIQDTQSDYNPECLANDLIGPTHLTMYRVPDNQSDKALHNEVHRLVPVAAVLGGLTLGCICVISDIFGVIGGGQGMLIATNCMYRMYRQSVKEMGKKQKLHTE